MFSQLFLKYIFNALGISPNLASRSGPVQNRTKHKLQVLHSVQKQAKHTAQTGMALVASMNVMETLNQNAGVRLIQIYISYPGAETLSSTSKGRIPSNF